MNPSSGSASQAPKDFPPLPPAPDEPSEVGDCE